MSKFYLQAPKPKFTSSDFRILSFKEIQKSLKKFKLFQIQKTIKKIKAAQSSELQNKLRQLKKITTSQINQLTIFHLNALGVNVQQIKTFIDKLISISVQNVIDMMEMETTKNGSTFAQFAKDYKESQLYTKAKQFVTKSKKKQKKRNKINEKKKKQENKDQDSKNKSISRVSTSKSKYQKSIIKDGKDGSQIKTRYSKQPLSVEKFSFQSRNNTQPSNVQQNEKEMHPSWAAKLQQSKNVVFTGKKISLI